MAAQEQIEESTTHRFSWDGFSFDVPIEWNLSEYFFESRMNSVQMEDARGVRLELEWIRTRKKLDKERLHKTFAKSTEKFSKVAISSTALSDLPNGWAGSMFNMPENKQLLMVFWLSPDNRFFGLFRFHFEKIGKNKPRRLVNDILASFVLHTKGPVPWEVYDLSLSLSPDFRLVGTSLEAGRKLLIFQWRLRKLYLWQFSLADILLREKELNSWASDFLNAYKGIQGPIFTPGHNGAVLAGRKWNYPLGHYDEIGRLCYRYEVGCVRLPEKNSIILSVYNYRKSGDLAKLSESVRVLAGGREWKTGTAN